MVFDIHVSGYIHDAVLLWAYGVNKTLEHGHSPDDGLKFTENVFNMTFEGITGKVFINEKGDGGNDQVYVFIYIAVIKCSGK